MVDESSVFSSAVYWSAILIIVVQNSASLKLTPKFQIKMGNTTVLTQITSWYASRSVHCWFLLTVLTPTMGCRVTQASLLYCVLKTLATACFYPSRESMNKCMYMFVKTACEIRVSPTLSSLLRLKIFWYQLWKKLESLLFLLCETGSVEKCQCF